jgi:hypothetical protein
MARRSEAAEAAQREGAFSGPLDHLRLAPPAQVGQHVESGGDAADLDPPRGQAAQEPVSPAPVGDTHTAHLPVVGAGGDEIRERELVEGGGEGGHRALGLDHRLEQRRQGTSQAIRSPGASVLAAVPAYATCARPSAWRASTARRS